MKLLVNLENSGEKIKIKSVLLAISPVVRGRIRKKQNGILEHDIFVTWNLVFIRLPS